MVSTNAIIYGSDVNSIQSTIRKVLGDGYPTYGNYGYGVTLSSSQVSANTAINGALWQTLANDLNVAYYHQNGSNYAGYGASLYPTTSTVAAVKLNDLASVAASVDANRLAVHSSQLSKGWIGSSTYGGVWGGGTQGLQSNITITFASTDAQRNFFNQGGSIQIEGIAPGLSGSNQDYKWRDLMNGLRFSINRGVWAGITGTSSNIYLTYGASPYTANYIQIVAALSGNDILMSIIYKDNHTNPWSDAVSAGIGYNAYSTRVVGAFTGVIPGFTLRNGFYLI